VIFLFLNHDSCLPLLVAGDGEVEGGVQSRGEWKSTGSGCA
jgi:hypothetical protein